LLTYLGPLLPPPPDELPPDDEPPEDGVELLLDGVNVEDELELRLFPHEVVCCDDEFEFPFEYVLVREPELPPLYPLSRLGRE
jgi:hypothetical protein